MTDAKIIQFPSDKIVREISPDPDIVLTAKKKAINRFGETVVEEIMEEIEGYCLHYGLEDKPETEKDKIYLLEVVRAMVYRTLELEHPMHEYIEKSVEKEAS